METKYFVNGVAYTDKAEAEKAEAELLAEKEKKEVAAKNKKARADEVAEAYKKLTIAKNNAEETREKAYKVAKENFKKALEFADKAYDNATKEAFDNYKKLLDDFCNDYGSYHMSYYNDGKNESIKFDTGNSISDVISDFIDSFNNFRLF